MVAIAGRDRHNSIVRVPSTLQEKAAEGYKMVTQNHGRAAEYKNVPGWWGIGVNFTGHELYIKNPIGGALRVPMPMWMRKENEKFVADQSKAQHSVISILTR